MPQLEKALTQKRRPNTARKKERKKERKKARKQARKKEGGALFKKKKLNYFVSKINICQSYKV